MDRFAWLDTQGRWILPWRGQGCIGCSACEAGRFLFCHSIHWLFQGFASFNLNHASSSHLFFMTTHSTTITSDPAQMVLRLGVVMQQQEFQGTQILHLPISNISGSEKLILTFDNSNPFVLEFSQVDSMTFWSGDTTCCSCQTHEVLRRECSENVHACGCKQVPSHITLKLQHVALNLYTNEQSNEAFSQTISLPQVKEILDKICQEQRQIHLIDNKASQAEDICMEHIELQFEASEVINQSRKLLPKYLNDVDRMCEHAMKLVEICSADYPGMERMLSNMAQLAGYQSLKPDQVASIKVLLHRRLKELMEREKFEIEKIWGANSQHLIQQQKMQDILTSTLKFLKQERKCIEEALLWVELMNTRLAI